VGKIITISGPNQSSPGFNLEMIFGRCFGNRITVITMSRTYIYIESERHCCLMNTMTRVYYADVFANRHGNSVVTRRCRVYVYVYSYIWVSWKISNTVYNNLIIGFRIYTIDVNATN